MAAKSSAAFFSALPFSIFLAASSYLFDMIASSSIAFGGLNLNSGLGGSFGLGPSSQVLSSGASSGLGSLNLPMATGLINLCTFTYTSGLTSLLAMSLSFLGSAPI